MLSAHAPSNVQLGQTTINDVLGNYWSLGAAIVIR